MSAGRPHASLPNSHAVGSLSSPRGSTWSRACRELPSAASTRSPAARSPATTSATGPPCTRSRWKMLPADARTHLLLYGSTEASEKTTPLAPAASAVRSTVPALPGSRTLARITTSRGAAPVSAASGTSTNRQTAMTPWGVMVCASSAMTSPLTTCTAAPCRLARAASPPCRERAAPVRNNSVTTPPRASASPTACGPSARNDRARTRSARLLSCRAAFTRGERTLVSSGPEGWLIPALPTAALGSGGGVGDRLRQCVLGHLDQFGEGGRVRHREFGEHAPVHVDAGGLQALDEPVVGHAVRPRRGVDPLDPQPAERALAVLAARIGVRHRVEHLLLGLAVHPRPLAAVPAGPLKHHPALLVGVDRPLHACHFLLPGGGLGYLASNFLIFLTSAGATGTSPASRRVTLLDLCSNSCLRFARRRSTFPVPVSRKRLFAPLCVFIFGMLAVVFRLLRAFRRGSSPACR